MQTKDRIIETMIDFIKEDKDISQISLSEIAKKAEIGKSTVYEYFSNKDELVYDTYMYMFNYYEKALMQPLKSTQFKDAFIEQVKMILDAMKDAKNIIESIMNKHHQINYPNQASFDEKLDEIKSKMEERFIDIFKLGIEQNDLKPPFRQDKTRGYVIQALINGLLFQYINGQTDLDENELLNLIFDEVIKTFIR
jgi:AcrR family transcriptional regulator